MNVKIVVAYHDQAPKQIDPICVQYPDKFVLMLGNSYAYKKGTDEFFDLLQRDDEGDNISVLNRSVSEFSVTYWAYKNQHRLGYPDMIGLAHYRRVFDLDYNHLDQDVIYVSRLKKYTEPYLNFFLREVGYLVTSLLVDNMINLHPSYQQDFESVLSDFKFYDKNMFIMNPRYLEMYMEFMLRIMDMLYQPDTIEAVKACWLSDPRAVSRFLYKRSRAYIAELGTAVFFEHLHRLGYPLHVTNFTRNSYAKY